MDKKEGRPPDRSYFENIPESIQLCILKNLCFASLLASRSVNFSWNRLISVDLLNSRSTLQVSPDRSPCCKRFFKGKWIPAVMTPWTALTLHFDPEDEASTPSGRKTVAPVPASHYSSHGSRLRRSALLASIKSLTLYEGGCGSYHYFMTSLLPAMPGLTDLEIKETGWKGPTNRYGYYPYAIFWSWETWLPSWRRGMKTLAKIKTFKLQVQERVAFLVFLYSVKIAKSQLVNIELDLSKLYGLPLRPFLTGELTSYIGSFILHSKETLRNLKIKWSHRVESDGNILSYSQEIDPFVDFLVQIFLNPLDYYELQLQVLELDFPIVSFMNTLVHEVLVPFLHSQSETLVTFRISRVQWEPVGVRFFQSKFNAQFLTRFEYGIYLADDTWVPVESRLRLGRNIVSVEFFALAAVNFNLDSLNHQRVHSRRSGQLKWKRHPLQTLRVCAAETNFDFEGFSYKEIMRCFSLLKELELISNSVETNRYNYGLTNAEFNSLFLRLTRLESFKGSNLGMICDSGLTLIGIEDLRKMEDRGVYFPQVGMDRIPLAQATCLKYLDLRDLSDKLTDISIFLVFQHIPKLRVISFHGSHKISKWGTRVLYKKFQRSPNFRVEFPSIGFSRRVLRNSYMTDYP